MKWSRETVRYLLIGQTIVPFFINIAVNIFIGALTFWGQDSVETWTWDKGAAADSIGTCFFLPFITCLIATPIVRSQSRNGTAPQLSEPDIPRWTQLMGGPLLLRATKFGIVGMLLFAAPVYVAYSAFAPNTIESFRFIAIKSLSAGLYGIFATPLIAFVAMCDQPDTCPRP
jgi:hypothetical protein